ncbi:MAG: protein-glutamine glutaminase family protein [Oligoflexia bacterium]|nr:protein-glutamine glutaminase family protein [Oligoflexia bacterium]
MKKTALSFSITLLLATAALPLPQAMSAPSEDTLFAMYGDYEPTVLPSVEEAEKLYRSMRPRKTFISKFLFIPGSQCYERAQVWSWDLAQSGIKTVKVVLWYSQWYYEWYKKEKSKAGVSAWVFHVAPGVLVGPSKEIHMLDRGFDSIKGPMRLQEWANVFLEAPYVSDCKLIRSAHEFQQVKSDPKYPCFFQVVPMYYYSPMLFEDLENQGAVIREFSKDELDEAFKSLKPEY